MIEVQRLDTAAADFDVAITDYRKIALAAPVTTSVPTTNSGNGTISPGVVDAAYVGNPLTAPVTLTFTGGQHLVIPGPPPALAAYTGRDVTLGIRPEVMRRGSMISGPIHLIENSGSDTFVHVDTAEGELVAQLTGVHRFELGEAVTLHVSPGQVYVFDPAGALARAPEARSA